MLKVYNIKDKLSYLKEVLSLEYAEWGDKSVFQPLDILIANKMERVTKKLDNPYFCKLILLDDDQLVGFISIFPNDSDERLDLTPWYATMYVKKEFRGKGYSKILNEAIISEAKKRHIKRLYLKTDLVNYYEKFGATYMGALKDGEKLYYMDVK